MFHMDPTSVYHTNRHVDLYITRVPDMGSICKMKMLCSRSRCLQTTPYRISIQNVDWYDPFFLQHGKNRGHRTHQPHDDHAGTSAYVRVAVARHVGGGRTQQGAAPRPPAGTRPAAGARAQVRTERFAVAKR